MPPCLETITSWRLSPPAPGPRPARDPAVEGIRGGAALAVLAAHLFAPGPWLDPAFTPSPALAPLNLSHAAVLVFFVLSGYVIGLVTRAPFSTSAALGYVRRRAFRLVPLNVVAVTFAVLAVSFPGWSATLLNLLFLQNASGYFGLPAPLLPANLNLWSLNYEVACYAAFLVVWALRPRAIILFVATACIGLAALFASPGLHFLGHWALGFLFWLAGLALAWHRTAGPAPALGASPWPAAAFALIATRQLEPLHSPLARLGLDQADHVAVIAPDLAYLAPAAWLIAAAAGLPLPLLRRLAVLSCLPLLLAVWHRLLSPGLLPPAQLAFGLAATTAACAFAIVPVSRRPLAFLAPIGLVSYALYALAAPIQALILICPLPSGSPAAWTSRAFVVIAFALLAAWLFEKGFPGLWKKRTRPGTVASPFAS